MTDNNIINNNTINNNINNNLNINNNDIYNNNNKIKNSNNEDQSDYLYFDDILPIFLKFKSFPVEPKTEYETKIMNVKKQYYIQGNKKRELAEWYLEYIELQTDKFLIEEDSFNFSVIPTMYLDTPPSSMAEIDRDLIIVRKYIDSLSFSNNSKNKQQQHQQHQQQHQQQITSPQITTPTPASPSNQTPRQHNTVIYNKLVNELISKVHALIDIFIKESLCILYFDLSKLTDQFKIDIFLNHPLVIVPNNNNSNNEIKIYNTMTVNESLDFKEFLNSSIQIIKRLQRKQQHETSINIQDLNSYMELVKDIEHLNTMKIYDKEFFQMDHSILSADNPVVGVTGLIVNRLHRLENELKTIQQHWNITTINSHNQHYNAFNRR